MVCSRGESLTHHINRMKLLNAIAAAAVISGLFITSTPAEAFWFNNNGKKIVGRWECEARAEGRSGSKSRLIFSANNTTDWMITQHSSMEDFNLKSVTQITGDYRVKGEQLNLFNSTMVIENQSYVLGNTHAENIALRAQIETPGIRSEPRRPTPDSFYKISAVSDKHLILQPEGGGSGEIICRK